MTPWAELWPPGLPALSMLCCVCRFDYGCWLRPSYHTKNHGGSTKGETTEKTSTLGSLFVSIYRSIPMRMCYNMKGTEMHWSMTCFCRCHSLCLAWRSCNVSISLLCCYVADYSNKWRGPRWRDGPHKKILELGQVLEILIIYQLHPRCIETIVGFCWLISAQKSLRIIINPIQRPILKATVFDVSWFLSPTRQWTWPSVSGLRPQQSVDGIWSSDEVSAYLEDHPTYSYSYGPKYQLYDMSVSHHMYGKPMCIHLWPFLSCQGP